VLFLYGIEASLEDVFFVLNTAGNTVFLLLHNQMEDTSEQLDKLVQKFVLASGPGNRPTHEAGVEELQRMAALRHVARCYILALLFIQSNLITSE
jgi:hypothetical protein